MPNSSTLAFGGGGANTTGLNNFFSGLNAGSNNTTGNNNVFIGNNAGFTNTTGFNNFFSGLNAGSRNTTGNNNVFIGNNAGFNNTTGFNNFFFGQNAGSSNTTASNSVLIGTNAGRYINADRNFIFGSYAGENTTTGYGNTMFAYQAGRNNTTGTDNLFLGNAAGLWNKTGSGNIFIGNRTGSQIIADSLSGYNNILIGSNAGDNIRAAAIGNVGIGNQIDLPTNNGSNQLVIKNVYFATGASGTGTTIAAASKAGIKTNAPNRDLEVAGEVRITDLTTDPPTRLVGADADGDLGQVTLGAGLGLASSSLLADTSFLVTRFDTASMLTNYLRTGTWRHRLIKQF
jgi:trimeric autotransporter adhesin